MYLGLYQTIIGSTLWVLVYQCLSGSPVNNTQQVWNHILQYYKAHKVPCQFASIGLTTFHKPGKPRNKYPRLKGKGMEAKYLLNCVISAFEKFKRLGNDDDKLAIEMLKKVAEVDRIIDESSSEYFVSWAEALRAMDLADEFLELHAQLHNKAATTGLLLWHTIPKTHMWWHLIYKLRLQHPKLGSTCVDEDFVGRIKGIVIESARGVKLHAIPNKVLAKCRMGKFFMYSYADVASMR